MALVNEVKREINAKIVFVGPVGAGKSTSLNYIYRKLKPEFRSQLKTVPLQDNRMLFFDFMPPGQCGAGGYDVRFHIYTILGDTLSPSVWKMLLKGVDGVVFVADSDPDRTTDNLDSLANIKNQLDQFSLKLGEIPWLVLGNKQDLDASIPLNDLIEMLEARDALSMSAVATKGEGVLEGLYVLIKVLLRNLRSDGYLPKAESAELQESPRSLETDQSPDNQCSSAEAENSEPEIKISINGLPSVFNDGHVTIPVLVQCGTLKKVIDLSLNLTVSS